MITDIKINNKLVPMGYKLKNGDQIHVTTNKSQRPTESWLKVVVTGRARAKIRSAIKEEKRAHADFGKEALQRKLKNIKADFEENVDMLVKHFGFNTRLDLYYAIYAEELNLNALKNFKVDGGKMSLIEIPKAKPIEPDSINRPRKEKFSGKPRIHVNGQSADQYEFTLASCCNPVQGDDIFAYFTTNQGLKIHRTSCPNAENMMANYGYRIMQAEWVNNSQTNFVADLVITGVDSGVGVIEKLSNTVSSDLGINIRSFSIAMEKDR
ncbi:MAG: RelA/SpoT AH/RIS domain-containing protein, partial [Bacteroidota bacterium]